MRTPPGINLAPSLFLLFPLAFTEPVLKPIHHPLTCCITIHPALSSSTGAVGKTRHPWAPEPLSQGPIPCVMGEPFDTVAVG